MAHADRDWSFADQGVKETQALGHFFHQLDREFIPQSPPGDRALRPARRRHPRSLHGVGHDAGGGRASRAPGLGDGHQPPGVSDRTREDEAH